MLFEVLIMVAPEVFTNPRDQLWGSQRALCLNHGSLGMHPMRLNGIQPRALDRQPQSQNAHAAFALHLAVMRLDPATHLLRLMPRGIVPDQSQHALAVRRQLLTNPLEAICRHLTHRPPINKAQEHSAGVTPQQSIAADGLWLFVRFTLLHFLQLQRGIRGPGVESRLFKPAPPAFICIAEDPGLVGTGEPLYSFQLLFFRRYCGSGLVIQSFARFHFTPRRAIALRMASRLRRFFVSPCSQITSATSSKVQRLVGLPYRRGEVCSRARSASPLLSSMPGRTVLGRRDPAVREASPRQWKSRSTLRTVCVAHPSIWAMCETRSPRELARRIWQRRTVNAWREWRPFSSCLRSSIVKDRRNIGGFIPPMIAQNGSYTKSLLHPH